MIEINQIKGRQIAAARVLAGISQAALATAARISVPTLGRMEASDGRPSGLANNIEAVRAALEQRGVEFIEENGGGAGVRLAKRSETVADLTHQIDVSQAEMTPESGHEKPSPNRAMKQLRRAHDQNELVALKNRRAKTRKEEKK